MTGCGVSRIELRAVRTRQSGHVARVFDDGELHAQTDAEIRNLVLAGEADRPNLPFYAALAEAARDEDRVHLLEARRTLAFDTF